MLIDRETGEPVGFSLLGLAQEVFAGKSQEILFKAMNFLMAAVETN